MNNNSKIVETHILGNSFSFSYVELTLVNRIVAILNFLERVLKIGRFILFLIFSKRK
ncbi:hypothetical protein LEP1GSC074_1222 [Leptospira noguchii str. Hook]|uniref:Uncharacterized protein n=1 Tax=Leptospira noguchii serovar Autumnalis str. ZUN142 TaxID=1085540 RepID=M6UHK3_9LEPT|nr:hypothetical protein LEP1GSC041_0318 [Leptospira noguchii str. 2006001870]EMO42296.1 hypothetical protein LEP1GSC186_0424 [Leptospira noguchii serovar Autumnalis str. ZUN142]EMS89684.1 hypothetical protein LEP1GSC074_1222 [Leptospira noguchii str. Hook]